MRAVTRSRSRARSGADRSNSVAVRVTAGGGKSQCGKPKEKQLEAVMPICTTTRPPEPQQVSVPQDSVGSAAFERAPIQIQCAEIQTAESPTAESPTAESPTAESPTAESPTGDSTIAAFAMSASGRGLAATFRDSELERDFLAYCQLASPIVLRPEEFEVKRAELLEQSVTHFVFAEFNRSNVDKIVCRSTFLEPLATEVSVEKWEAAQSTFARLCAARLLTEDEERSILRRMHFLKHLAWKILTGDSIDQWGLARAEGLLRGALWHRDMLIQANMRLVVALVRKMPVPSAWHDELVSDGVIALLRAIEKFDPRRGFRFSTYATPAIRRECFLRMHDMHRERNRFASSSRLSQLVASRSSNEVPMDRTHWILWRKRLLGLMRSLPPRERLIIRSRYCLGPNRHVKTLQRLASYLNVSKERVRQLEQGALVKLRMLAESEFP